MITTSTYASRLQILEALYIKELDPSLNTQPAHLQLGLTKYEEKHHTAYRQPERETQQAGLDTVRSINQKRGRAGEQLRPRLKPPSLWVTTTRDPWVHEVLVVDVKESYMAWKRTRNGRGCWPDVGKGAWSREGYHKKYSMIYFYDKESLGLAQRSFPVKF